MPPRRRTPEAPNERQHREYYRQDPPVDFLWKIKRFSSGSDGPNYKSSDFEVGGYKWRLSLSSSKDHNRGDCISLYLSIRQTDGLPSGWTVKVRYKFFLYNPGRKRYLTVEDKDPGLKIFQISNLRKGFDPFISLKRFKGDGYLVDDSCQFGAEVLVGRPTQTERLTISPRITWGGQRVRNTFEWPIQNFSKVDQNYRYSNAVAVFGDTDWRLCVARNGMSLSIFLEARRLPTNLKVHVDCILRVVNQKSNPHREKREKRTLSALSPKCGRQDFMPLSDLDQSTGFIHRDVLKVQVQILTVSTVEVVGV